MNWSIKSALLLSALLCFCGCGGSTSSNQNDGGAAGSVFAASNENLYVFDRSSSDGSPTQRPDSPAKLGIQPQLSVTKVLQIQVDNQNQFIFTRYVQSDCCGAIFSAVYSTRDSAGSVSAGIPFPAGPASPGAPQIFDGMGRFIYVANEYDSLDTGYECNACTLGGYALDRSKGSLQPLPSPAPITGYGVGNDPAGRYLFVYHPSIELPVGSYGFHSLSIDAGGLLTDIEDTPAPFAVAFVQHPNAKFLYLVSQTGSSFGPGAQYQLWLYTIDLTSGRVTSSQQITQLPHQPDFVIQPYISPSGKWLLLTSCPVNDIDQNGFCYSIVWLEYSINADSGNVVPAQNFTAPEHLNFSPQLAFDQAGQFIYSVGSPTQDPTQSYLYGFSFDDQSGAVTELTGSPFFGPTELRAVAATH